VEAIKTAYRIAVVPSLPAGQLAGNGEIRVIPSGSQGGVWICSAGNVWRYMAAMLVTALDSGVLAGNAVTLAGVIPANCLLMGVTAQVTVAVTGSATWDLGDDVDGDCYGAALAPALGTQANVNTYDAGLAAPIYNRAAALRSDIIITNDGANPFTGGRILIRIYSLVFPYPV